MTRILAFPPTKPRETARFPEELSPQHRAIYRQIPAQVSYVYHPSFASLRTEADLYGDDAEPVDVPAWTHFPEVVEDMPARQATRTVLRADQEAVLFLRYNYARYRLARLLAAQQRRKSLTRTSQMILWHTRAAEVQAAIVRANMALVLAMAKQTRIPNVEFSELVSEGNMALLRSVEKFDVARGFKFSTYACRAILKSFNRLATNTA